MTSIEDLPEDFQECVRFHGHVCPGLAIGYTAAKAAANALGLSRAEDEETVVIVENDSCAVDAIQTLLGCTFGKGNLIFRDWGKQVYTVMERKAGKAVRLSLLDRERSGGQDRRDLKVRIDSGDATPAERKQWEDLRMETVRTMIEGDPSDLFEIREIQIPLPPTASIVSTQPCDVCREQTIVSRLESRGDRMICPGCALDPE